MKRETRDLVRDTLYKCFQNLATIHVNEEYHGRDYNRAEAELNAIIFSPKIEGFPSCKTYFLKAKARYLQGRYEQALQDIGEAEKLAPKNFDMNQVRKLKE